MMLASLRWLRDFLDRDVTAQEVQHALTTRTATVESMTAVREDLAEIVVGRVVAAERHPDADHLWLASVDSGSGELLQVVCGAPVVEVGTSYPLAPVGATLPGGIRIEKRKIRGQVSTGMLCSARELGLGSDHTGILAIETEATPGTPLLQAVDVGDVRFEIDVLPNRPDLLSHEGIAREIAAAAGTELRAWRMPAQGGRDATRAGGSPADTDQSPIPNSVRAEREASTDGIRVAIEDADGCWRYAAVVIRGVTVRPSPRWLTERLEAVGVRSINNVVDVTNFMLHGFGQPMHAFDLPKMGGEVVIRRAAEGERITTLDGVDRPLDPSMTVIAGARGAEAIAGVIGGQGSEVTERTTDLLLEVAVFNPKRVRATRRALGISTDASYRFERHVDLDRMPDRALLGAQLIRAVAGGQVTASPVDANPVAYAPRVVSLRPARVGHVLGEEIVPEGITALLQAIGFGVATGNGMLRVAVPSWRDDIEEEIDLIEEAARLHGYDAFSSELRPFRPTTVPDDPLVIVERRVREALVAEGMFEIRPIPFVSRASDERLRVRNPLAENEAFLRESLLDTLVRRAEYNLTHMQRSVRLFEIGTVFSSEKSTRPGERTHVGALVMGHSQPPHFTEAEPRVFDIWDVKSIAELVVKVAFGNSDFMLIVADGHAAGDEQRHVENQPSAVSERELWKIELDGRPIGRAVLLRLDAPVWAAPAYGVEVDITEAAVSARAHASYVSIPPTPAVEVDVALVVPDDVPAGTVEQAARRLSGSLLESIVLFDEFRGPGIEPGTRSLAWRLTFRHPGRTLRDRDVESRKQQLIRDLEARLGVKPRG